MELTAGAKSRQLRLTRMQEMVKEGGPIQLAKVAEALGVTVMTVRRDLAAANSPLACLGGYVLEATLPGADSKYSLDQESDLHTLRKRSASQLAASWIENGDSIFIDCGTTMTHFAEALPTNMSLNVVCYSMNIANIISKRPNTQLILLGGVYHSSSASFSSEEGLSYLGKLGINKAFLSAGGVDPVRGVSCSNFHEVPVKQAALKCAAEKFLVIDESKLGRFRPAFYSPLDVFSRIAVGGAMGPDLMPHFESIPIECTGMTS